MSPYEELLRTLVMGAGPGADAYKEKHKENDLAKSLFEKKEAFKKTGFTEEQAFELVKTIIESM